MTASIRSSIMDKAIKQINQRIIDVSRKFNLSHISSNLSCAPVLLEIYQKKKKEDIVILDCAHAHLAHLVVQEYKEEAITLAFPVEELIHGYGIHCNTESGCDAPGGSLGHGLGIGIGYALVDNKTDVYIIVSEGSMLEGSSWEALRIADQYRPDNLHIYTNFNGFSAVAEVDVDDLIFKMKEFYRGDIQVRKTNNTFEFEGVQGHYRKL